MAVTTSYPGIYIQELPSSSHSITAAPTNIAVFIGYTHPLKTKTANFGKPVQIFGFMDYQREFGGFVRSVAFAAGGDAAALASAADQTVSFGDMAAAVSQFFLNGGTQAYVVGLRNQSLNIATSFVTFGALRLTATEITDAAFHMKAVLRPIATTDVADLIITYGPTSGPGTVTETYRQISLKPTNTDGSANPNFALTRLGASQLVTATTVSANTTFPANPPPKTFPVAILPNATVFSAANFTAAMAQDTGLDKLPVFNLMVVPGVYNTLVMSTALAFCEAKRAFLLMDPPLTASADDSITTFPNKIQDVMGGTVGALPAPPEGPNAALYFPYLKTPDPVTGAPTNAVTGLTNEIPPAATVAGLFAATDLARGVWKAPAGFQTIALNTTGVTDRGKLTDQRQGVLNLIGVDCLRDFPNVGTVVFGARTLVINTNQQWGYVPVRRMALFLEQSLLASLGWVVFEPNDEPLWSAITMSINAFMLGLFRQGAFQGAKPSEAFSVQCNSQTTTQADIDNGRVNIVVAFAPLKPAEFVIISIAQLAGQASTG